MDPDPIYIIREQLLEYLHVLQHTT
jgi:hypothetical protein